MIISGKRPWIIFFEPGSTQLPEPPSNRQFLQSPVRSFFKIHHNYFSGNSHYSYKKHHLVVRSSCHSINKLIRCNNEKLSKNYLECLSFSIYALGFELPKIAFPETNISAPAAIKADAFSRETPPSTSICKAGLSCNFICFNS